jgi:hypothetical protein
MTLYAQWLDPSVRQYTVTYHANGADGTVPAAQTVNEGRSITLPGAGGLTYGDRTFNGWNTAANGSGAAYAEGATYTVNADTTFYAQWVSGEVVPEEAIIPPGSTLAEKFAYIAGQADDGTVYDIVVTEDVYQSPLIVSTTGRNVTVVVRSQSPVKTINLDGTGAIFTVSNNITLTLQNIRLAGRALNTSSLVAVSTGGTLIIENGAEITGNTNNIPPSTGDLTDEAGGVFVQGAVVMNGGSISGNKSSFGGGVEISNGGSFTLKAGVISDNECKFQGGGVAVYNGSFTMNGGIISGNKQTESTGGSYVVGGGGVFIGSGYDNVFSKIAASGNRTCGVIYGAVASEELRNIAVGRGNGGGDAVLGYSIGKHRDTTLGEYDEISTLYPNVGWE